MIPKAYYGTFLADTVWFELTPGETPNEVEEDPDEELIVSITPDVLGSLLQSGFFAALDNLLCSINNTTPPEVCYGDFRLQNAHYKIVVFRSRTGLTYFMF